MIDLLIVIMLTDHAQLSNHSMRGLAYTGRVERLIIQRIFDAEVFIIEDI